jgi:hypothetical protein
MNATPDREVWHANEPRERIGRELPVDPLVSFIDP